MFDGTMNNLNGKGQHLDEHAIVKICVFEIFNVM